MGPVFEVFDTFFFFLDPSDLGIAVTDGSVQSVSFYFLQGWRYMWYFLQSSVCILDTSS